MLASSLQEILELIYAPNAVQQIFARKAYSWAIRDHVITSTVDFDHVNLCNISDELQVFTQHLSVS